MPMRVRLAARYHDVVYKRLRPMTRSAAPGAPDGICPGSALWLRLVDEVGASGPDDRHPRSGAR